MFWQRVCYRQRLRSFPTRRSSDLVWFTIDLNMVRAGVVNHPEKWNESGFVEIQKPPKRYAIIDLHSLSELSGFADRSEEHTSELQSQFHLVCRLLLEKKNQCSDQA